MPAATPFVPKLPPLRDGVERELPPAQVRMLRAIYDHHVRYGTSPTIRELNVALGIASPNGILCTVRPLVKKGYIFRAGGSVSRSLMLTQLCFDEPRTVSAAMELVKHFNREDIARIREILVELIGN